MVHVRRLVALSSVFNLLGSATFSSSLCSDDVLHVAVRLLHDYPILSSALKCNYTAVAQRAAEAKNAH